MTISFEIPGDVEKLFVELGGNVNQAVKEAALVELYRLGKLFHSEFAAALGTSRYEADGVLKRHGVFLELSAEELDDDIEGIRRLVGP